MKKVEMGEAHSPNRKLEGTFI